MLSRNTASFKGNAIRMAWTAWSDQAFEHQLTLLNWFPGRPYPGDSAFKLKRLSGDEIDKAVAARKQAAEFPDDIDFNLMIHIVSWSDGMDYLPYSFIYHSQCFAEDRSLSLEDQRDIPLVIDADGKVLSTVKDSKKYLRQIALGKPKTRKARTCDIPAPSDDEAVEAQSEIRLSPAFTSRRNPSRHQLSEPHPAQPAFPEEACNWDVSTSDHQPRLMKRLPVQRQPARPALPIVPQPMSNNPHQPVLRPIQSTFSEDIHNQGVPASENQSRPTKRLHVDHAQSSVVSTADHSDSRGGTTHQPPPIPHSSRPRHSEVSRKRKQADLDEIEQENHRVRSIPRLVSRSQVQQPMYLHPGQPGQLHVQVPRYQAPHPHYADNIYHHSPPHHHDPPQPHF